MTVTDKFKSDSAMAAIRALRGLEQTAKMLETYAPELYPDVDEHGRKHFNRVMMESAAEAIRRAWKDAIAEAENSERADHVAEVERLREALVEISKGAGPFSRDPLTFAQNCIDSMKQTAQDALST